MEAHAAGEDDEALEQGLAAGDVFELQVRDAVGELAAQKKEKEKKEKEKKIVQNVDITVECTSKNQTAP